jgi:formylglycine-generating enzyme required for sulfatase activity
MAAVPAGRFTPGAGQTELDIAAFCLDLTEVTVAEYKRCVSEKTCSDTRVQDESSGACNFGESGREQHPMNCVTWTMADTFCKAQGKRLPTEAEWEWTARGGDEARRFPWGNQAPDEDRACWSGGVRKRRVTCEVGSFARGVGRFGHQDLAGNVWEWTDTDRRLKDDPERVQRGGGRLDEDPDRLSTTAWRSRELWMLWDALGFRCAR